MDIIIYNYISTDMHINNPLEEVGAPYLPVSEYHFSCHYIVEIFLYQHSYTANIAAYQYLLHHGNVMFTYTYLLNVDIPSRH